MSFVFSCFVLKV